LLGPVVLVDEFELDGMIDLRQALHSGEAAGGEKIGLQQSPVRLGLDLLHGPVGLDVGQPLVEFIRKRGNADHLGFLLGEGGDVGKASLGGVLEVGLLGLLGDLGELGGHVVEVPVGYVLGEFRPQFALGLLECLDERVGRGRFDVARSDRVLTRPRLGRWAGCRHVLIDHVHAGALGHSHLDEIVLAGAEHLDRVALLEGGGNAPAAFGRGAGGVDPCAGGRDGRAGAGGADRQIALADQAVDAVGRPKGQPAGLGPFDGHRSALAHRLQRVVIQGRAAPDVHEVGTDVSGVGVGGCGRRRGRRGGDGRHRRPSRRRQLTRRHLCRRRERQPRQDDA